LSAHDEPTQRPPHGRARLTDSPWFWLLVFANAALVGVALIGPKYNVRQGAVERRYEARREIAGRALGQPASDTPPDNAAPDDTASDDPRPDENSPRDDSAHIVPLLPLALTLVVVNLVAIVLFAWNQVRLMRPQAENSHPHGR